MLKLYVILCVAFLCSSMSGFDGSLQGSLLVLKPFQDTFGAGIVGAKAGYITAMYTIGGVCSTLFVGPSPTDGDADLECFLAVLS